MKIRNPHLVVVFVVCDIPAVIIADVLLLSFVVVDLLQWKRL